MGLSIITIIRLFYGKKSIMSESKNEPLKL